MQCSFICCESSEPTIPSLTPTSISVLMLLIFLLLDTKSHPSLLFPLVGLILVSLSSGIQLSQACAIVDLLTVDRMLGLCI